MALTTRNVHAQFKDQNGTPIANALVRTILDQPEVDVNGTHITPEYKRFTCDSNGAVTMALWPNALGTTGSRYNYWVVHPKTGRILIEGSFAIPDIADNQLADISSIHGFPTKDAAVIATETAQAAAAKARLWAEQPVDKPVDIDPNAVAWAASTAYTLGHLGKPTTANNYYYEVTTAGTTGTTEPVWPTVIGTTVTDGTAVWTCRALFSADHHAVKAKASAGAAKTSETNAKTSETNSKSSETAAANSKAYAQEWANKAVGSLVSSAAGGDGIDDYSAMHHASKASTSETNAKTSETNAKTSETNAKTSETNAKTSETAADASEAQAKKWSEEALDTPAAIDPNAVAWAASTAYTAGHLGKPTTSNGYYYEVTTAGTTGTVEPAWPTVVGNTVTDGTVVWTCRALYSAKHHAHKAASSASAASTSETNAKTSETNAKTSETNAKTSETNAKTSETNAKGHYDTFRGSFYGVLTADPSTDPNGAAVGTGDWYFNSTDKRARIYDGAAWQYLSVDPALHVLKAGDTVTGNFTLSGPAVSVDGAAEWSPELILRGAYDSDATTGVLSAYRNIYLINKVNGDGSYSLDIRDSTWTTMLEVSPSLFDYKGNAVHHAGNHNSTNDPHTQYVKKAGDTLTGHMILKGADVTIDGGANASPKLVLRGTYDADGSLGVSSAKRDFSLETAVASGGPYSLLVKNDTGATILDLASDGRIFAQHEIALLRSGKASRLILGSTDPITNANGAYVVAEGNDYGGASAGGDLKLVAGSAGYVELHGNTKAHGRIEVGKDWDSNMGNVHLRGSAPNISFFDTTAGSHKWLLHNDADDVSIWRCNTAGEAASDWTRKFQIKSDGSLYTHGGAVIAQDKQLNFAGNSTWGGKLRVGGNGYTVTDTDSLTASVVTTNGNLHIDSGDSKHVYLNWYNGSGVRFGNGNSTSPAQVAEIDKAGNASFNGNITAGSIPVLPARVNLGGATVANRHTVRDGAYHERTSSVTGAIKITLPFSWTDTMLHIKLRGYDYSLGRAWELIVGGYNYSTNAVWYNTSARLKGNARFERVRFAHDGTKCCIILGDIDDVHSYPTVEVVEVLATYSNGHYHWFHNWSTSRITAETGLTFSGGIHYTGSLGWHNVGGTGEPAFQNGWVNYGGSYNPAAFRLDNEGFVHLRGLVKSGTMPSIIFALPVGYRPAYQELFDAIADTAQARIDVQSNGSVALNNGTNGYVSLDGITFKAA